MSLAVFGNDAAGLRVLFVFAGILAFFPIYAVLKSRLKCPEIIAVLILNAPQIVLFQRNARYYSLLILLYAVLVWHLSNSYKSTKIHFTIAALLFILFFHTHPFAALCSAISLVLFCLVFRRKVLLSYLLATGIGFLSWLVWYELLGPPLATEPVLLSAITSHFSLWCKVFGTSLWATIVDFDVVGCFPALLWLVLLVLLFLQRRKAGLHFFREPLLSFIFLNILIQALATAALFGCETRDQYAILRYMPHLLVFALACLFMVLDAVITVKSLYLFVCVCAVACNFAAFSFWTRPFSRNVPVSWFPPVYSEIFRPQENAWDIVVARMRSESQGSRDRDSVVVCWPPWIQEVLIFHLGDDYLIQPCLDEPAEECEQSLRKVMGEVAYLRLCSRPEWILDFFDVPKAVPAGYDTVAVIPSHQVRPDDGNRPELTRHAFPQPAVVRNVKLFHLRKK